LEIAQLKNGLIQIKGQARCRKLVVASLEILLSSIRFDPLGEMTDGFECFERLEVKGEGGEVKKGQGSQGQGVVSSHQTPH